MFTKMASSKSTPIPKPRTFKRKPVAVSKFGPEHTHFPIESTLSQSQSATHIPTSVGAVGGLPKRRSGPPPPVRPKAGRFSLTATLPFPKQIQSESRGEQLHNRGEDQLPSSQDYEDADELLSDVHLKEDHFAADASEIEVLELSKESGCATEMLVKTCNKILKEIEELYSLYHTHVIPETLWSETREFKHVLQEKDILIGILGQHNCGKSTLLNALIGHSILPMHYVSETSIKVKVQHDQNIHPGLCPPGCPQRRENCCCPQLLVMKKDQLSEQIFGPDDVRKYLQNMNKRFRERKYDAAEVPSEFILKVNIPLIAASIPPGWTISLVDNPGFGEAKEHVTQLADTSVVTSSAYIYLLQTENIGGTEAAAFFKEVQRIDSKAVIDGRLTIGIAKFDHNYEREEDCSNALQDRIIESIKNATDSVVTSDMIVPLCGEWALVSSQIMSHLISGSQQHPAMKGLIEKAAAYLVKYPHLSLPGGQGETLLKAIAKYPPKTLVQELEKASGMHDLKKRVGCVVGKACIKAWVTKVHMHFQNAVRCVVSEMPKNISKVQSVCDRMMDKYKSRKRMGEKIVKQGKTIKSAVLGENQEIMKEFAENYATDIEETKAAEGGKEKSRSLITNLKEALKVKIEKEELTPRIFEQDLKDFLELNAGELQKVFESSCGFFHTQQYLFGLMKEVTEKITALRLDTERLLGEAETEEPTSMPPAEPEHQAKDIKDQKCFISAPNLGDIMVQAPHRIPKVSLPWWVKVIHFFRKFLSQDTESTCKPYKTWTNELEETLEEVQRNMEDACDDYFKKIMNDAIKFFYGEYRAETLKQLKEFESEYGALIVKEGEKLRELQSMITKKNNGLTNLKSANARMIQLQKELCAVYDKVLVEFANSGTGQVNELEIAKRDMKRIEAKAKPFMHFDRMHS